MHPKLEAEKAPVGVHDQRADVVQHHHAVPRHQHIAGKAHKKGAVPAQVGGQHKQVVAVPDGLERHHPDVFHGRQVQRAAVVPVGQAHIQAGAFQKRIQPGDHLVDIAGDAGDLIAQNCAVDDDGSQT